MDLGSILTGSAVVIAQLGTTYVLITKSRADALEAQRSRESLASHLSNQDVKLSQLHESTNGLSKRAEELAGLLGEAKGEKAGLQQGRSEGKRPDPPHSLPESELPPVWPERPK